MKQCFIALVFILLVTGCENNIIFKKYETMDNISWRRFHNLDFEIPVEKNKSYDFYFSLRHHTDFPYNYLDVNITFYTPDKEMRSREYHFRLKNTDFKWKGDGMGELWDIDFPIKKNMKFQESGICKISFENKMPKMVTPGIIEVGLTVKESGN